MVKSSSFSVEVGDGIGKYLQEIGKTPLLSAGQEKDYGRRIKENKKILRSKSIEIFEFAQENTYFFSLTKKKGLREEDFRGLRKKFKKVKKLSNFVVKLDEEDDSLDDEINDDRSL